MITPSFALTATERVLPKLALDFTTASLDSRVTFTRTGGNATRVNSSGLIEQVAADTPRFDFNPVTLVCRGLLIEESRLNSFVNITGFSNAYFTKNRVTISTDATASPYSNINADKIIETATTGTHEIYREITISSSTAYTFSFYVKAAERTWVFANLVHPSVADNRTWFNLSTGAVGTNASGNTSTITDAGNGWWRITVSRTSSSTQTSMGCAIGLSTGNNTFSYTGDGTSGLFAYGLQHELGAFATSLITSNGSAGNVTRNADVATMTGTNFSDWYNASEGTFTANCVFNAPTTYGTAQHILSASDGTTSNRISIFRANATGNFTSRIATLGVTSNPGDNGVLAANTAARVAIAYKVGANQAISGNATVLSSAASPAALPSVTKLTVGCGVDSASQFLNGTYQKLSYYSQRLTNAEVQANTK